MVFLFQIWKWISCVDFNFRIKISLIIINKLEFSYYKSFFFSLSVEEINTALDAIAQANVEKERDTAKSTILKVIRSTSALEQKWFIRIMLKVKDIKISVYMLYRF